MNVITASQVLTSFKKWTKKQLKISIIYLMIRRKMLYSEPKYNH